MSNCKAQVVNPDEVEFKFEITFTLRNWRRIEKSLDESYLYPMSELADSIRSCVRQAEKVYMPEGVECDE